MSDPKKMVLEVGLVDFFRQEVVQARGELGLKMSEGTEFYLVNLLVEFGHQGDTRVGAPGSEPLALQYKRALDAELAERLILLKALADSSLYAAGFFTDRIDATAVGVSYYITMGGHAYQELAGLMGQRRQGAAFAKLYGHLAHKFTDWVDVLNQISERSRSQTDRDVDLLKLYDRWVRTGSQRLRRQLHAHGLLTAEGLPTEYAQ